VIWARQDGLPLATIVNRLFGGWILHGQLKIAAHDENQSRYSQTSSSDLTITPLRIDTDRTNNPK
jgi:hypothetical protein